MTIRPTQFIDIKGPPCVNVLAILKGNNLVMRYLLVFSLIFTPWASYGQNSCKDQFTTNTEPSVEIDPYDMFHENHHLVPAKDHTKFKYINPFYSLKILNKNTDTAHFVNKEDLKRNAIAYVIGVFGSRALSAKNLLTTDTIVNYVETFVPFQLTQFFRGGVNLDKSIPDKAGIIINWYYSLLSYSISLIAFSKVQEYLNGVSATPDQAHLHNISLILYTAIWAAMSQTSGRLIYTPYLYSNFAKKSQLDEILDPKNSTKKLIKKYKKRVKKLNHQLDALDVARPLTSKEIYTALDPKELHDIVTYTHKQNEYNINFEKLTKRIHKVLKVKHEPEVFIGLTTSDISILSKKKTEDLMNAKAVLRIINELRSDLAPMQSIPKNRIKIYHTRKYLLGLSYVAIMNIVYFSLRWSAVGESSQAKEGWLKSPIDSVINVDETLVTPEVMQQTIKNLDILDSVSKFYL